MNSVIRVLALASRKTFHGRRSFLSEAYKCQEVWNNRLNSPALKNINIDHVYQALDQSFQNNGRTSVVDVDLFANCVVDENFADELEDIVHKLRLSRYTSCMFPSTHHAVIRAYLTMGKYDALMRILNDRLNYGIFPDYYCSNLMMDQFLKEKRYREAAKVATLLMLQEEWQHPISSYLGLFSCHSYIINKASEPWEVEVNETDEPEEEVKVRVKYIQNKYFDDHFDLREPNHLIGKTLVMLGKALPEEDPVRSTYELIGWALYEKWSRAKSVVQELLSTRQCIMLEGVQLLEELLRGSDEKKSSEEADDFLKLLSSLPSDKLVGESSLYELMKSKVEIAVAENEMVDIENQIKKFNAWEVFREKEVEIEAEKRRKEYLMKKMNEKKKEIAEKEEILFFFENKDKLEMMIEKNEILKSQITKTDKKVKSIDEDYIPPDIK